MYIRPKSGAPEGDLAELTKLLDGWDPIGVYDDEAGPPPGEYNDLLIPIMAELRAGATARELAKKLTVWLAADYGIDPGTSEVAEQIVIWWQQKAEPGAD